LDWIKRVRCASCPQEWGGIGLTFDTEMRVSPTLKFWDRVGNTGAVMSIRNNGPAWTDGASGMIVD